VIDRVDLLEFGIGGLAKYQPGDDFQRFIIVHRYARKFRRALVITLRNI